MSTSTSATSINITFKTEGSQTYLNKVSNLIIGNMVDPATQQYWYGPIDQNPWKWVNDGTNETKFALMCNYNYEGTVKTAYSEVVIDPTQMGSGDHEVVVMLQTAAIQDEKSNSILMFKSATLDGKENSKAVYIQPFPKQSKTIFYGNPPLNDVNNSINITACDNELYIVAVGGPPGYSYQLCHILSGGNNIVNVTTDISQGTYAQPITYNGANGTLDKKYSVFLPKGEYTIMAVGIDWGGGQQAKVSVTSDGVSKSFGTDGYNPGPFKTPNVFWTNNGKPLTKIMV